jgi:alpha-amylase
VAPRISLALAIHNHQPVGNFGWVFAEVYEQAYEPMLEALERTRASACRSTTPARCSSGCVAERPSSSRACARWWTAARSRSCGGGLYEPVLASLPERDRIGQLRRMGDELEALFGRRPSGAWLAERVWEPDLPTLVAAGLRLDDPRRRPLPRRGHPRGDLWGRTPPRTRASS